ncbi:similar to Saccharomyces cerevisiae YAL040C CLN3 G1 cyclin involved in cell cycle progression [Maudiozyma saulgeensis]|uniref:Similar to Saccharomyces cerevisiae YAL040C CLN3 G1 cyclin involved in cell cycle progression n=1 Tax=Maudiozyma saulgeensis TaxID=1789683 RepID=A0A1X7R4W7_9SACH|nr:similar to Saccharomyces cerevisiae YAL040C CLN3 G1 cyclin involved in cell cycle progression [Kazachstania saulgeensis]
MSVKESKRCLDKVVNLYEMSKIRRHNSYIKSMNPNLVKRELMNHQMTIKEYHRDLSNHLYVLEKFNRSTQNNAKNLSCFKSQPYINSDMRYLIFEFLMCCHSRLSLTTSTLFQTFNLVDRYTSKFILKNTNYQLIALTCLWISAKFFDVKKNIPSTKILENLCCMQYTSKQFISTEFQILQSLNWSINSSPTADSFIDMILFEKTLNLMDKTLNINEIKILAIMLCELCEFKPEIAYQMSASYLAKDATTIALMIEQFAQNGKWFKISKEQESLLDIVFAGNEIIPASFKLKYDDGKLSKFITFIKRFKEEKIMNDYIASIIENGDKQQSTSGTSKAVSSSSSSTQYNQSVATSITPDMKPKRRNATHRDVIMPLTPTTPIYLKKRYHEEVSDGTHTNEFKRVCK